MQQELWSSMILVPVSNKMSILFLKHQLRGKSDRGWDLWKLVLNCLDLVWGNTWEFCNNWLQVGHKQLVKLLYYSTLILLQTIVVKLWNNSRYIIIIIQFQWRNMNIGFPRQRNIKCGSLLVLGTFAHLHRWWLRLINASYFGMVIVCEQNSTRLLLRHYVM